MVCTYGQYHGMISCEGPLGHCQVGVLADGYDQVLLNLGRGQAEPAGAGRGPLSTTSVLMHFKNMISHKFIPLNLFITLVIF